jgi:hypothetical protein
MKIVAEYLTVAVSNAPAGDFFFLSFRELSLNSKHPEYIWIELFLLFQFEVGFFLIIKKK